MTEQEQETQIPVGELCLVQIDEIKCFSAFRGFYLPDYILIDVPTLNGKPVFLPRNSIFQVRFSKEGMVYGFDTSTIRTYSKPFPICVIEYPNKIKNVNLRKSRRITTLLPAKLETQNGTFSGAIVDLSVGGGLFSTFSEQNGAIRKETRAFLHTALPSGEKVEKLPSRVCSVQKKGNKTLVGLCFEDSGAEPYAVIRSFYDTCALSLF